MLVAVLFEALVKDEMIQNAPLTNTFTIGPVVDTEFKRIRLGTSELSCGRSHDALCRTCELLPCGQQGGNS